MTRIATAVGKRGGKFYMTYDTPQEQEVVQQKFKEFQREQGGVRTSYWGSGTGPAATKYVSTVSGERELEKEEGWEYGSATENVLTGEMVKTTEKREGDYIVTTTQTGYTGKGGGLPPPETKVKVTGEPERPVETTVYYDPKTGKTTMVKPELSAEEKEKLAYKKPEGELYPQLLKEKPSLFKLEQLKEKPEIREQILPEDTWVQYGAGSVAKGTAASVLVRTGGYGPEAKERAITGYSITQPKVESMAPTGVAGLMAGAYGLYEKAEEKATGFLSPAYKWMGEKGVTIEGISKMGPTGSLIGAMGFGVRKEEVKGMPALTSATPTYTKPLVVSTKYATGLQSMGWELTKKGEEFSKGFLTDIKEKPIKAAAIYGTSALLGGAIAGGRGLVLKGAKNLVFLPKTKKALEVGYGLLETGAGGTLGGLYAMDITKELKSTHPKEWVYKLGGRASTEILPMVLGFKTASVLTRKISLKQALEFEVQKIPVREIGTKRIEGRPSEWEAVWKPKGVTKKQVTYEPTGWIEKRVRADPEGFFAKAVAKAEPPFMTKFRSELELKPYGKEKYLEFRKEWAKASLLDAQLTGRVSGVKTYTGVEIPESELAIMRATGKKMGARVIGSYVQEYYYPKSYRSTLSHDIDWGYGSEVGFKTPKTFIKAQELALKKAGVKGYKAEGTELLKFGTKVSEAHPYEYVPSKTTMVGEIVRGLTPKYYQEEILLRPEIKGLKGSPRVIVKEWLTPPEGISYKGFGYYEKAKKTDEGLLIISAREQARRKLAGGFLTERATKDIPGYEEFMKGLEYKEPVGSYKPTYKPTTIIEPFIIIYSAKGMVSTYKTGVTEAIKYPIKYKGYEQPMALKPTYTIDSIAQYASGYATTYAPLYPSYVGAYKTPYKYEPTYKPTYRPSYVYDTTYKTDYVSSYTGDYIYKPDYKTDYYPSYKYDYYGYEIPYEYPASFIGLPGGGRGIGWGAPKKPTKRKYGYRPTAGALALGITAKKIPMKMKGVWSLMPIRPMVYPKQQSKRLTPTSSRKKSLFSGMITPPKKNLKPMFPKMTLKPIAVPIMNKPKRKPKKRKKRRI